MVGSFGFLYHLPWGVSNETSKRIRHEVSALVLYYNRSGRRSRYRGRPGQSFASFRWAETGWLHAPAHGTDWCALDSQVLLEGPIVHFPLITRDTARPRGRHAPYPSYALVRGFCFIEIFILIRKIIQKRNLSPSIKQTLQTFRYIERFEEREIIYVNFLIIWFIDILFPKTISDNTENKSETLSYANFVLSHPILLRKAPDSTATWNLVIVEVLILSVLAISYADNPRLINNKSMSLLATMIFSVGVIISLKIFFLFSELVSRRNLIRFLSSLSTVFLSSLRFEMCGIFNCPILGHYTSFFFRYIERLHVRNYFFKMSFKTTPLLSNLPVWARRFLFTPLLFCLPLQMPQAPPKVYL